LKKALLFSTSRSSSSNAVGLRLLHELSNGSGDGEDLIVVLMQDAVLLALKDFYGSDFPKVSEAYVLDEHLAKRGITPQSLKSPFKPIGYDEIVELVMKDETHVIGSF